MSNKQATDRVRKQFAEISESPERLENLTRSLKKAAEEAERITEQLREERRVDSETLRRPFTL